MVKSQKDGKMQTLLDSNNGFSGSNHIPAFLAKLWKIVDDPATNDLIYWSEHGNSFLIRNQSKFARELLPLYYKHNNMASFVRQLNMYGFHKVVSVEQGGLKVDKDEMEFAHPFFLRGSESTLELIKRKISSAKIEETRTARPDTINKVILDVRQMKGRQDSMDSKLMSVKRENEALWRELSILRQKHAKQQQIVSKLLQFLVGMMSSQGHRLGFKRRMPMTMPLMLSDSDSLKGAKISKPNDALSGPVIHDVTEGFRTGSDLGLTGVETLSPASDSHIKVDSPASFADDVAYTTVNFPFSPNDPDSMISFADPVVDSTSGEPFGDTKFIIAAVQEEGADSDAKKGKLVKPAAKAKKNAVTTAGSSAKNESDKKELVAANDLQSGNIPAVMATTTLPGNINLSGEIRQTGSNELNDVCATTAAEYSLSIPDTSLQLNLPDNISDGTTTLDVSTLRDHLDDHLDDVQNGLDNLKNLLKEDIALDKGTLMTLFGTDSSIDHKDTSIAKSSEVVPFSSSDVDMSLQEYNPSLYELTEDDSLFGYENDGAILDEELQSMLTTDRENLLKGDSTSDNGRMKFEA